MKLESAQAGDVSGDKALRAVKGMLDWVPPQSRRVTEAERRAHELFALHGYAEARTPAVEHAALFARSIGETTDIVEKEMYSFRDRDDALLTLRPEGTAGIVRAYVEHGVAQQEPLTRWYYMGPMFRHERAQRGRQRQFFQIGAEVLGAGRAGIDAELLGLLVDLVQACGLAATDFELRLSSLGCPTCRPGYRQQLVAFLEPLEGGLCPDCQRRLQTNPLRVLDCKREGCRAATTEAPAPFGLLCGECRAHWDELTADLQLLGVAHVVDARLVRGLDYYTRTAFELTSSAGQLGAQNTIAGGGRYDGLVEQLGGPPTPAIGFALGLERLLLAVSSEALGPRTGGPVYFVVQGDPARRAALLLARRLRAEAIPAEVDQRGSSMKSQMKRADRVGAQLVVLLGESEVAAHTVTLRQMGSSTQETLPESELSVRIRQLLGR